MSDKPHNQAKSSDHIEEKASEKHVLNPSVAEKSQTDAKGQKQIEGARTNKHDGSAGKSDKGDIESIRIESIDEHGNKRVISRKEGGSEQDLLPADRPTERATDQSSDRPVGGFDKVHRADGGITLKGVIPGPGKELENITTGTMKALAAENALVRDALEMRKQIDQHMEQGPEKDKVVSQLKADVTASLMSGDISDSEVGGTHKAITDNSVDTNSEKPEKLEKTEQDWQSIIEKVSQLPIEKQFDIIGTGLQSFNNEIERQKLEIAIGTIEGVGEGFKSVGEGIVSLANGLGQIGQFSIDVITNNPRALETGAQAGESIGKTLVGGVRLFQMSHDYLYDIGFTGDYAKPFNDIANLGNELNRRWQELPPGEKAKIAAKMSTETVVGMAVPFGANKLAKADKVTEMMEEFAAAAKTLGKESKAVDAIEDTVDTLSKRGLKAIDVDGYEVFDEKRPIHDRRHLQNLEKREALEKIAAKIGPVNIENRGASPEFMESLTKYVEELDPHERIFLAETDTKVVGCRVMSEINPRFSNSLGGLWDREANTIYLPEKVLSAERRNPASEFHLRHEIGHAFNDHSIFNDHAFSDKRAFKELFNDAYENVIPADNTKLPFTKSLSEWEAHPDKRTKHKPDYSRHEVFADLYAHITGIGARTEYSEALERNFGDSCSAHIRELVSEYIHKVLGRHGQ